MEVRNNTEDGEYLANQIKIVMEEVGSDKVNAVCTDNASNNKKAWEIVEDLYVENIISFFGCAAHVLNLLSKDILDQPSAAKIFKDAKVVIKEIKESHVLLSEFTDIQKNDEKGIKVTLKIPAKTRWGSASQCLESILVNKHNLIQLTESTKADRYMKESTKETILDDEFWFSIAKLLQLLKPISSWITILESDDSKIHLVIDAFLEIEKVFLKVLQSINLSPLNCEETGIIFNKLTDRYVMAIRPIHQAANFLAPISKGKNLNQERISEAQNFILLLANKFNLDEPTIIQEISEYSEGKGVFASEFSKKSAQSLKPSDYWKNFKKTSLSRVAIAILECPASSASTERSFSTKGWIHSSKRNRLTTNRAIKLAYVCHNIKLLKSHKSNERKRNVKNIDFEEVGITDEDIIYEEFEFESEIYINSNVVEFTMKI